MKSRPRRLGVFILAAHAAFASTSSPFQAEPQPTECAHKPTGDIDAFNNFVQALDVLQNTYFQPWLGTWPQAIDWTSAVLGTYLSGALSTISKGMETLDLTTDQINDFRAKENLITAYFSQVLSYYFGQDDKAIRMQAYDDILWVVLGWLETIQFVGFHSTLYSSSAKTAIRLTGDSGVVQNRTWHGNLWVPAFAHRARVFWELAARGWDEKLCGGGLTWNPRMSPYKNAITNELFIAASASMYLYFPGDDNTSSFLDMDAEELGGPYRTGRVPGRHDEKFFKMAMKGYRWLAEVKMKDNQGLYCDGFHISGYDNRTHPGTKCDELNPMVYTYNQGVILTGHRALFEMTKNVDILIDAHDLIRSVIDATGYDLETGNPVDDIGRLKPGQLPPWRGLGRAGVLEDACDVSASCSQDSQTFKGIFFHHLTAFCAPLANPNTHRLRNVGKGAEAEASGRKHKAACADYLGWIRHNALAALGTRDAEGKFGMWWTASLLNISASAMNAEDLIFQGDPRSVDYRNKGVPDDIFWKGHPSEPNNSSRHHLHRRAVPGRFQVPGQVPMDGRVGGGLGYRPTDNGRAGRKGAGSSEDPNERGRGRTVETQGGGVAVLRALWEIERRVKSCDLMTS